MRSLAGERQQLSDPKPTDLFNAIQTLFIYIFTGHVKCQTPECVLCGFKAKVRAVAPAKLPNFHNKHDGDNAPKIPAATRTHNATRLGRQGALNGCVVSVVRWKIVKWDRYVAFAGSRLVAVTVGFSPLTMPFDWKLNFPHVSRRSLLVVVVIVVVIYGGNFHKRHVNARFRPYERLRC